MVFAAATDDSRPVLTAVDAGDPATPGSGGTACEATDQRGVTRPQGAACDIGAFELEPDQQPSPTPTPAPTSTPTQAPAALPSTGGPAAGGSGLRLPWQLLAAGAIAGASAGSLALAYQRRRTR